jgi:hypothetical protein
MAESASPQPYRAYLTLCSRSNPPSAYHSNVKHSHQLPVRATQRSYFIPKSVLKGRVGTLRTLSHNFDAVEKDEGDMAVDNIPIGNVS